MCWRRIDRFNASPWARADAASARPRPTHFLSIKSASSPIGVGANSYLINSVATTGWRRLGPSAFFMASTTAQPVPEAGASCAASKKRHQSSCSPRLISHSAREQADSRPRAKGHKWMRGLGSSLNNSITSRTLSRAVHTHRRNRAFKTRVLHDQHRKKSSQHNNLIIN